MKQILLITSNAHKIQEYKAILGARIVAQQYELDEIQSIHPGIVAKQKALQAFAYFKKPLMVEDTGLMLPTWNNFPGALIKHIGTAGGCELLLRMLSGEARREAMFVAAIAYHDGTQVHSYTGTIHGSISTRISIGGWGFDPVFMPDGYTQTFGELDDNIKNSISHRAKAIRALQIALQI